MLSSFPVFTCSIVAAFTNEMLYRYVLSSSTLRLLCDQHNVAHLHLGETRSYVDIT